MLFSSTLFLIYFLPIFFTLYFVLPKAVKNYFIVSASILFYAWGAPSFVFVLLSTVVVNFTFAHLIYNRTNKIKKIFLVVAVVFNLAFLLYFKYANFFIDNFNILLSSFGIEAVSVAKIILPIGISFFTFHQLSFIIDIYRGVKPPMRNILDYALYILIFPQLIAGPIIRYHEISDQIEGRNKAFNVDQVLLGFLRFSIGLAKKVLIANVLGKEADKIFDLPVEQLDFAMSWLGAITYTFQIYFDFSGYSDMAIGLAKMMGFTFPENFNNPYIAQSITDFWRRWHISLSRWMRDYLYIPLGGNKVSGLRLYFNLWIVFLISGFWHGAEWTFILWGAYHGFFLAIERLFLSKILEKTTVFIRLIYSFTIVILGWVLFRATTMDQAFLFIKKMFSFSSFYEYEYSNQLIVVLLLAFVFSFAPLLYKKDVSQNSGVALTLKSYSLNVVIIVLLMIMSVSSITSSDFNPFIYFKF
ncbi:MAG: MBOAT family protein [Bacteroidia bacterium]|nr:MBOAT family protein [Bacteroidia bacterium]